MSDVCLAWFITSFVAAVDLLALVVAKWFAPVVLESEGGQTFRVQMLLADGLQQLSLVVFHDANRHRV